MSNISHIYTIYAYNDTMPIILSIEYTKHAKNQRKSEHTLFTRVTDLHNTQTDTAAAARLRT